MYVVIAVTILFVLAAVFFDVPIPFVDAPQPTATEPVGDPRQMQTEGFLERAESEQARSGLDRGRNSARQQPMASDPGRPIEENRLSAQETITKDSEANLQSAREVAFADKLAEANHNTAAQVEVVQKRLESEQVKATSLDRDLAGARQELAQASREKAVGNDERRSFEAAAADNETKLQNEQKRAATLIDKLAEANHNTAAQVEVVQKRLESEQVKATSLDRDLAGARQELAQAGREKAVGNDERRSFEAAAADNETKLQNEQKRAATLVDKLAEANHNTAAQVEVVQKRLQGEQVKATSLDRDLAGARQELAQAGREKAVGNDERRSFEAAAADNETKLQNEQTAGEAQKPARTDNLQHVTDHQSPINSEPNTTAQIEAVRQKAGSKRAALERSEASVAGAARLAARSSDLPPPLTSPAIGALSKIAPPEGVPARVVLRYARGSEAARTRAIALRLTLQAQGFDVTDPVNGPSGIVANGVTFFYREDQSSASRIAGVLATSGPIQSHLPANDPLPRPGTIEVAVAG